MIKNGKSKRKKENIIKNLSRIEPNSSSLYVWARFLDRLKIGQTKQIHYLSLIKISLINNLTSLRGFSPFFPRGIPPVC